jgi:ribosomal protein S3
MKLAGRFTRKQRAGHYWFSRGRAPLNTLSALVDFAIFYLPLKNSTISVRVWLYKSVDLEDMHYIKLF